MLLKFLCKFLAKDSQADIAVVPCGCRAYVIVLAIVLHDSVPCAVWKFHLCSWLRDVRDADSILWAMAIMASHEPNSWMAMSAIVCPSLTFAFIT